MNFIIMYEWKNIYFEKPIEIGYYYTKYFNDEHQCFLYKAIWFDGKNWQWWNLKYKIYSEYPHVVTWLMESRNDFYVPCVIWASDNYKNIKW